VTLIVEDGSGKPDAQSYASVSDLRAYAVLRATTLPDDDTACEVLLIKAMDRLADENFQGIRASRTQALAWPRYDVVIEEYPVPSTELPRQLIFCQCAFAIEAQTTELMPTADTTVAGAVIEETVGPITTRYDNNGIVRRLPAVAKADALLRCLIRRNGLMAIRS
jgi:hypothetical protein